MAVEFDGTAYWIACADVFDPGTGDFTIALWAKASATAVTRAGITKRGIVGHESMTNANINVDGSWVLEVDEDTGGTNYATVFTNAGYDDGLWHHIAFTRSGVTLKSYVDGALHNTTTAGGTANISNAYPWRIGYLPGGMALFLGQLEDCRVINRALSIEEIGVLAAGYRGPMGGEQLWISCMDATGIAHWDGATLGGTNIMVDLSHNANDGTPQNSPVARASEAPRYNPSWGPMHAPAGVSFTQSVGGTLTMSGALAKNVGKNLSGTLTMAGVLSSSAVLRILLNFVSSRVELTSFARDITLEVPRRVVELTAEVLMPTENDLIVKESPVAQGLDEQIGYKIRVKGATTVTIATDAITVKDGGLNDVTTSVMAAGDPSVSGTLITLPKLQSLVEGAGPYNMRVKATIDGNLQSIVCVFNEKNEFLIGRPGF